MCVFNLTFQGGNQLLFEHWQLCVCVSLSLIAIIVGWFVPIFCVLRVTQRAYLRLRILCHIQKHAKNPREKKNTRVQIWWYYGPWLLFYLTYARTCTIFAWVYREDVDAVCSTLIGPSIRESSQKQGKENTIVMNKGFGRWSHFLHEG